VMRALSPASALDALVSSITFSTVMSEATVFPDEKTTNALAEIITKTKTSENIFVLPFELTLFS